jgi:hypothetical protein
MPGIGQARKTALERYCHSNEYTPDHSQRGAEFCIQCHELQPAQLTCLPAGAL